MHKAIAKNRKAKFEYHILETFEAGIVLTGTEIKSCRAGSFHINEAYARFIKNELFLVNSTISPYKQASVFNHDEKRLRKLLLNKNELLKLLSKTTEKGLTLIPLSAYFNEKNRLKIELALAQGKKLYDKREDIKKRDINREMQKQWKNM